ncbi:aluminum resistance protein [Thermacetogenium phaeum DSM 12270]|uniref:Aluminum resistance protein n=1 Tax=Thermacetogenium phaeum (strain ATCC BAA-254 / DSM 26808 / PB) TaxID=1089553 RepID=K4LFF4_THEPS|nr:aluminum resistance protein [Thermacetogenium phaeum DSM 12270]
MSTKLCTAYYTIFYLLYKNKNQSMYGMTSLITGEKPEVQRREAILQNHPRIEHLLSSLQDPYESVGVRQASLEKNDIGWPHRGIRR